VVNPDISVVGQPTLRWSNDPEGPDPKRFRFDPGEVELVFDSYLNPYARGTCILSVAEGGIEVEEGYFTLLRGLPGGLSLKGGKYRAGFGRLNPAHPHTYPFAERFRVLQAYLPGDEAMNETGLALSGRVPAPGDLSLTASLDWLQGDSFRRARAVDSLAAGDPRDTYAGGPDREGETRPAFLARLSAFAMAGERSGLEFGLSATEGTNNVAAAARTRVYGADAKAKLWNSPSSYLVLQGELLALSRDDASWNEERRAYGRSRVTPFGGYLFADYAFSPRYDLGVSYERFQRDDAGKAWEQGIGLFGGIALMEETTAFRLGWNRFQAGAIEGFPARPAAVQTVTLRVVYSMGPHKAHQF
jgi:hypothetical protein